MPWVALTLMAISAGGEGFFLGRRWEARKIARRLDELIDQQLSGFDKQTTEEK